MAATALALIPAPTPAAGSPAPQPGSGHPATPTVAARPERTDRIGIRARAHAHRGVVPGKAGASVRLRRAASRAPVGLADGEVVYTPPVDAPVTDPFRPPPQPWLPGNRGIEYATAPGTPVQAAGRGTVTFAGQVGGALHVTITHPDGVRTSYSYLATIAVPAGAAVARGRLIGTTGPRLHVGARRGSAYIDPASLWATGPPRVRLVPLHGTRRSVLRW